jgi:hypothetical protein
MIPLPKRLCTCLLFAAAATPAYPWGKEGHQAIALVASQNLSADARAHVIKVLGSDDLASIATWMDELRQAFFHTGPLGADPEALKFNAEFPHNSVWHYADLPLGTKAYELGGPFSSPDDVVHRAEEAIVVLEGGGDPKITRREALYMLVHFVGDEHQPLHVGCGFYDVAGGGPAQLVMDPVAAQGLPNDKGGNSLFYGPGKFDELHAYWDDALVTKVAHSGDAATLAAVLQKGIAADGAAWKSAGDYHHWPEAWATESLVAARKAYAGIEFGTTTLKPHKAPKDAGQAPEDGKFLESITKIEITLPAHYDDTCIPIAETRLSQGAYHLTEILNAIKWAD